MKKIALSKKDKFAVVDDEDYGFLSRWKWVFNNGYAVRQYRVPGTDKRIFISMHVLINSTPAGFWTDHINGDRLDNRRENLRTCTCTENLRNQKLTKTYKGKKCSSRFKGVSVQKSKARADGQTFYSYFATITINGTSRRLHGFNTEIEAALGYNQEAVKEFGEFALLNPIPEEAINITNEIARLVKQLLTLETRLEEINENI